MSRAKLFTLIYILFPLSRATEDALVLFFKGNVPANTPTCIYGCTNNLTPDCFLNEGQFNACFVIKLKLKDRFVPIVRDPAALPEEVSLTLYLYFMIICQSPLLREGRGEQGSLVFIH